jgi:hypothetical protein
MTFYFDDIAYSFALTLLEEPNNFIRQNPKVHPPAGGTQSPRNVEQHYLATASEKMYVFCFTSCQCQRLRDVDVFDFADARLATLPSN